MRELTKSVVCLETLITKDKITTTMIVYKEIRFYYLPQKKKERVKPRYNRETMKIMKNATYNIQKI
jgi:hypothetical protein